MTKNIAEPSSERRIANVEYRTRQLERRPVPFDTFAAWAYVYRQDNLTVPTDDFTRSLVSANGSDSSDTSILAPNETGGYIDILEDGIYEAVYHGQWAGSVNGQFSVWVLWRAGSSYTSSSDLPLVSGINAVDVHPLTNDLDNRFFSVSDWQLIPIPHLHPLSASSPVRVLPVVYHEVGNDFTMDEGALLVRRVGDYP